MRPLVSFRSSLSIVAAFALSLSVGSDAAIVYEGFNYSANSGTDVNGDTFFDLSGSNGGTGFAGPWYEDTFGAAPELHSYDYIQSGSMAPPANWSDLAASGNSLRSINVGNETLAWRPLAPIDISAPRTLWMSFLVMRATGADGGSGSQYFTLLLSPTDTFDHNFNLLQIGDGNDGTNYALYGNGIKSDTLIPMVGSNTVTPVPAFLVVKMTFNPTGNDRFELFVSPTASPEPLVPNAVLEDLNLPSLNYIGFRSGGLASRTWSLDEIRIGDTYEDVTPLVPEPTAGLMSLAGAAVLGFRRRR